MSTFDWGEPEEEQMAPEPSPAPTVPPPYAEPSPAPSFDWGSAEASPVTEPPRAPVVEPTLDPRSAAAAFGGLSPSSSHLMDIYREFKAENPKGLAGPVGRGVKDLATTGARGAVGLPLSGYAGLGATAAAAASEGEPDTDEIAAITQRVFEDITGTVSPEATDVMKTIQEYTPDIIKTAINYYKGSRNAVKDAAGDVAGAQGAAAAEAGLTGMEMLGSAGVGAAVRGGFNKVIGAIDKAAGYTPNQPSVTRHETAKRKALKQKFPEGTVHVVQTATPASKAGMKRMIDIMEEVDKNPRLESHMRPSNVLGDSLKARVDTLLKANREAGQNLDKVAMTLRGKAVDMSGPVNNFRNALAEQDIHLEVTNKGVTLRHGDMSPVEGLAGLENALKRVSSKLWADRPFNAYDAHRIKRIIDEMMAYGKTSDKPITGKVEIIIKSLRHDIDAQLDANFPEYNKVNTQYHETKGPLEEVQRLLGRNTDINSSYAASKLGTLMRRITSQATSRTEILSMAKQVEDIARKYGGKYDDNLYDMAYFINLLEKRFGSSASTSFQGQVDQPIKRVADAAKKGVVGNLADIADRVSALSVNDKKALAALRELLQD